MPTPKKKQAKKKPAKKKPAPVVVARPPVLSAMLNGPL